MHNLVYRMLLARIINQFPLPIFYCQCCQQYHWKEELVDEPNGAAYCPKDDDIMWDGPHTMNESNYVFGCLQIRRELQQQYEDQWAEYYGSRF